MQRMGLYAHWFVAVVALCQATAVFSQCLPAERSNDMQACLLDIGSHLTATDEFWFGTDYTTNCPQGPIRAGCFNANYPRADSVESRLFPDGLDLSLIEKYLEVNYTSEAGSYDACGNTFVMNAWQREIIPGTQMVYEPWHLKSLPQMTWDASNGEHYTVIFYDVGSFIWHMLAVNIPGNDIQSGEVIKAYNGPKISYVATNVYAYFLYKQEGQVTVTDEWKANITNGNMKLFPFAEFASDLNLTGPVAVNWVKATGDPFAAEYMKNMGVMDNCPAMVSKEMNKRNLPILPNPAYLSVVLDVKMVNYPIQFTVCCKTTNFPRQEFALNPFKNPIYNTAQVRTQNSLTVTLKKGGFVLDPYNFTGEMYTLMAVDPDVPSPSAGTTARPILHMMYVNIEDGDLNTGDVVLPWSGPTPPDNNPHYYYFLLYKQEMKVNASVMPSYDGDCSGGLIGRCLYDVNRVVSEQKLTLVGANWLRAVYDDYVIQRRLNQSDPVAVNTTCFGRPCPAETSAGYIVVVSYIGLLIAASLVLITGQ